MWYYTKTSTSSANASLPKPISSKQFTTGRAPFMPKAKLTCYSSTSAELLPHRRLLMKLQHCGIDDQQLDCFSAVWLSTKSDCQWNWLGLVTSASGVPQRTVIGPILFFIYINYITCDINSWMRFSADDNIIYPEIRSTDNHRKLQDDITKFQPWSKRLRMTFKQEKCYVFTITSKRYTGKFVYHIKDVTLES